MKRSRWAALAAIAIGAPLILAAPAMAQPGPDCPVNAGAPNSNGSGTQEGDCTVTGTLTVGQSLAIALDFTAVALTPADTSAGSEASGGNVYVLSNDSSGYFVSTQATGFKNTGGTVVVPGTDLEGFTYSGTTGSYGAFAANPETFAASSAISGSVDAGGAPAAPAGWDSWAVPGYFFSSLPNLPAGSYADQISYALWGN